MIGVLELALSRVSWTWTCCVSRASSLYYQTQIATLSGIGWIAEASSCESRWTVGADLLSINLPGVLSFCRETGWAQVNACRGLKYGITTTTRRYELVAHREAPILKLIAAPPQKQADQTTCKSVMLQGRRCRAAAHFSKSNLKLPNM